MGYHAHLSLAGGVLGAGACSRRRRRRCGRGWRIADGGGEGWGVEKPFGRASMWVVLEGVYKICRTGLQ
jgi:hypothetical protein